LLATTGDDAQAALAAAGNALAQKGLPVEVRGELFRGIARHVRPDRIPGLIETLQAESAADKSPAAPSRDLRRAALEGCLVHAVRHAKGRRANVGTSQKDFDGDAESADPVADETIDPAPWIASLWKIRWDSDARLRKCFGELLAVLEHADAFEVLKAQLGDQEPAVRDAAAVSLGMLGTPEAKAELQTLAQRPEERTRMIAVRGLSAFGIRDLAPFAQDKS